ncbi:MAG: response regulator [Desulfonauticus sp.]|nr:response regulator [Desulfonauticus sp.]
MKKVLIVDDAQTVRKFERMMIEEMGYVAEEAINGLDGLEKLYNEKFDLALVDINMPKMDGYEFTRQVRQDKEFGDLPIVIISTESKETDKKKAYEAGANYFIVKPIKPETLKSLLKIFL